MTMQANRGKTIFFGIVLGAATGLLAAVLLTRRAEENDQTTAITAGTGLKLGVMIIGLLRAVAALGDDESRR
jgi:DMSO reductase anchor subunit